MSGKPWSVHKVVQIEGDEYAFAKGCSAWHGGAGWYYWSRDYPDEGSCGPFSTLHEAEQHLRTEVYS